MTAPIAPPITDHLPLAIRAYAAPQVVAGMEPPKPKGKRRPSRAGASPWQVVFDTETTSCAGQALRFGTYQVRYAGELKEAGIFYAPDGVTPAELNALRRHAVTAGLRLLNRDEFADQIFFAIGWQLRATIIGFNLPFDISRIAIRHSSARTGMRGGFSFKISKQKIYPNIQVKHLSQRMAFIRCAATMRQSDPRSARKRGQRSDFRAGHFVDVKTLAGALLSRSFKLAELCAFLKIQNPKLEFDDFDGPVTDEMIGYAVRDVQATWECYADLIARYDRLGLTATPPEKVYSEASLGKGYFAAMGIEAWRRLQPDFPRPLLANIMGSYFGGRSEIRIRREVRQVVLCDFLSMYPTVCTLMGLWRFITADGMTSRDATAETAALLETIDLEALRSQAIWGRLATMVRVLPDADVFPVRAAYSEEPQTTIGANYLSGDTPLWFTLADCIASKLATGKSPKVIEAVAYSPGPMQAGLRPVDIAGNPDYRVDPATTDFFKRMIELRQSIKIRRDAATGDERDQLDIEQNAIKIAANSTSYGMYVEVNVAALAKRCATTVLSSTCNPFDCATDKAEEPGPYFHPLLATLITGAARLMLATAERLVSDHGLEWSFCDTDSMAIARPAEMDADEFAGKVAAVVAWFGALNPYAFGGSILNVEKVNFALDDGKRSEPLYCWAVSAKRYALFNVGDDGAPVMRKVSAHGLGHLLPPYKADDPAVGIPKPDDTVLKEGIALWHSDLWFKIASAALAGHPNQVALDYHPAFDAPAISRYGASSPDLLRWFKAWNRNRPYRDQVKPFGFLLAMSARHDFEGELIVGNHRTKKSKSAKRHKPISAYDRDYAKAVKSAFDRESGEPVPSTALKSYGDALAQYHIQPESKFLNANYLDRGVTARRHVRMTATRHIGKESNDWERQAVLGLDKNSHPDYGVEDCERSRLGEMLRAFVADAGLAAAATALRTSPAQLKVQCSRPEGSGRAHPQPIIARLPAAIRAYDFSLQRRMSELDGIRAAVARDGLRETARRLGVDPSNLRRKLGATPAPGR